MSITVDTVSARELFGGKPELHLSKNINEATKEAKRVVEAGELIRETHGQGNMNTSLESTYEGSLRVAQDLANRVTLEGRRALWGTYQRGYSSIASPLEEKIVIQISP